MELAMTRENFWKYIAEAHKKEKDNNGRMNYLVEKLSNKSYEEIFSFGIIVDEIMLESYNQKLWCASYLLNGDTREESFDFFRLWLISQGEKIYNDVMKNPDNLIKYVEEPDEDFISDLYAASILAVIVDFSSTLPEASLSTATLGTGSERFSK